MTRNIGLVGSWILWLLLSSSYFLSRLISLGKLPIFTDEAIYIRWSQIGANDASWRFISLTDGKQPLFTWIMMVYLKLFQLDPLIIGRLVSVTAGFLTMVGLWFLTKELTGSRRIAFISSFLYIILPFGLLYDRMALYDSWVAALSVWNLYIAVRLAKDPTLDKALILGMSLAVGMLNKSSGFLSLYLVPTTLLLFDWQKSDKRHRLFKWGIYVVIAALLSQIYYSVLRLSPFFHMISLKDKVFLYSFGEWSSAPFKFFVGNIRGLSDWLIHYLTIPVIVTVMISFLIFKKKIREKILLCLWWLLPFVALALFGKVLYPRFVLFMSMPLLVLSAMSFEWIIEKARSISIAGLIYILLLFSAIQTSYFIITDPIHAPIPQADRGQIIDDWPSGGGIREVNSYLAQQAQFSKIAVYTDGTFGLLPYAIEIYLVNNPNVEIHGIWPLPIKMPLELTQKSLTQDVYVILNQYQKQPKWPIQLIATYQKGTRQDRTLRLYKVISPLAMN